MIVRLSVSMEADGCFATLVRQAELPAMPSAGHVMFPVDDDFELTLVVKNVIWTEFADGWLPTVEFEDLEWEPEWLLDLGWVWDHDAPYGLTLTSPHAAEPG